MNTIASILIVVVLASSAHLAAAECEPNACEACGYDVYSADAANEYSLYLRPLSPSSNNGLGASGQDGTTDTCRKQVNDAYKDEYRQWGGMTIVAAHFVQRTTRAFCV